MYYVGLDTHLHTSTCCILDANGQPVKTKTLTGPWAAMVEFLGDQPGPLAVCYEASCGYGPLHDALAAFVQRVVVAHPGRLRLIFRSKRKNDRIDAAKLAKLLYLDEVPAVHVPSVDVRAWRELINFRRRQIHQRASTKCAIRALLRSNAIVVPHERRYLWTHASRQWLRELTWPTLTAALRRDVLLDQLDHADDSIQRVTDRLDRLAADHAGVKLLRTIPGVGPRTAEAVVAFLDDPHRFARNNRVGAYVGLIPSQDASAHVNRLGHITKEGPSVVRWLLVEAAWQVARRDASFKAFFDRIAARHEGNRKKAVVATAHKLLRAMHSMLRTGETWNPRAVAA